MTLIQFFPIDISYETNQEGKAAIQLFGRTVDGKKICVIDPSFKPYFYVIPYNKEQLRSLSERILEIRIERENEKYYVDEIKIENKHISTKPVDLLKVYVNHPKAVNEIKKEVKLIKEVKDVRENDINFTKRYLIDKDILMLNLMEVEGDVVERNLNVEITILANELKQVSQETFSDPRILAFDIESYTPEGRYPIEDKDPVIMISFYSNDGFRRVFTYKEFKTNHDYIKFVDSEYDLIQKFLETLEEYNPDFLVGYYTDGFDFPYLKARARKNGIKLMFNNSTIKISRKGQSSATKIKGLPHLDLLKFIRHIMSGSLRLDSYSLNSVAFELLKEKKLDMNPQFIGKAFDEASLELERYCEYNLKDSELTLKIAEKILPNLEEIARLINTTIFDVCRMPFSGLVETYLMKRAKEFDEIFPNKPTKDMEAIRRMNSYQGAFIFDPIPGLHKNVVVFDFQSLYPSIIVAHNIDPSTLTNKDEGYKTPEILLENGEKIRHRFSSNVEGLIPSVIRDIITRRVRVKEMLKSDKLNPVLQARSYALKTLANSTYGYYAYFGARWYCRECAESITSFGRFYIQSLIERAQKEGFNVIYGDSLTSERFVTILDENGFIRIKNIQQLFEENKRVVEVFGEKEVIKLDGIKALTFDTNIMEPNWSPISRIIRHKTNKKIFRVNQKFGETRVTEDHSLITKGSNGQLKETKPQDLTGKNMAYIDRLPTIKEIEVIDTYSVLKKYSAKSIYKNREKISEVKSDQDQVWFGWTNRKKKVQLKRFIKVGSPEFDSLCRLLGAYIAEGSSSTIETTTGHIGASIATSDVPWLENLQKDYYQLFSNATVSIIKSNPGTRELTYNMPSGTLKTVIYQDGTHKLQMMNQLSAVFFKAFCGQKSIGKKLPDFIFHVSEEYKRLLLEEMIKGDGSRYFDKRYSQEYLAKNFRYTTKSLAVACGLTLLLTQLRQKYIISYRPSKTTYTISTCDNHNSRESTKAVQEDYEGYVYDLSVPDSQMFVDACGQILVHNTDALFIALQDKTKEEALVFLEQVNRELPSLMELDLEDFYLRGIFVSKRGERSGAKKKYALISEDGRIKVRGFETIRRDWSTIAREVQKEVINIILIENDPEKAYKYVFNMVKDVREKKIDLNKMIIQTVLKKGIDSYDLEGPHVIIARKMKEKGIPVQTGSVISYIVTEGKGRIRDKATLPDEAGNYDAEYYINNQIIPAVETIFDAIGYSASELLTGKKQTDLGSFF